MSFVRAEEFVELRRLDRGSGEHRMRLPAMMDLVLEQMREEPRRILGENARAALQRNRHDELRFGERRTCIDQPAIGLLLRLLQLRASVEGLFGREEAIRLGVGRLAAEGPLQRVDVVPIDGENVIERRSLSKERSSFAARRNQPATDDCMRRAADGSPTRCCRPS